MRSHRILVAALLVGFAIHPVTSQRAIVIDQDDSLEEVRMKVLDAARAEFGEPGFGLENVAVFVEAIEALAKDTDQRYAALIEQYVSEGKTSPGVLSSGSARELAEAFRWLYLVEAARREATNELMRVIADYDGRMEAIDIRAAELAKVFEQLETLNNNSDKVINSAIASATKAQESLASLSGVMETYRRIILDQNELIEQVYPDQDAGQPDAGSRTTFSLLGGPGWSVGASSLDDVRLTAGSMVGFPILDRFQLGLGFLTSFPPESATMLVELRFSR